MSDELNIDITIEDYEVGSIEVNWGSMYSGKTEELIKKIRRSKIAGKKVELLKPKIDNRYSLDEVVTHYGDSYVCKAVRGIEDVKSMDLTEVDVVGIDEGQFFDDLVDICRYLKYLGKEVIVSGLDMWSTGEPILNMALLSAIANKVNKFNAVCVETGKDAYISHSIVEKESDIQVGGSESYVALSEEAHLMYLDREARDKCVLKDRKV